MSARLTLTLLAAGLLVLPTTAFAATKHGITPLAPKAGQSVPAGKSPTFKLRVKGKGPVYVHVCKNKKKNAEGLICARDQESVGRARRKGGVYRYKPRFFDYPGFWLNSPGTYYWQAHRIACEGGNISDCRQEGPIVKIRVAGG
jgi:hypothetical protein